MQDVLYQPIDQLTVGRLLKLASDFIKDSDYKSYGITGFCTSVGIPLTGANSYESLMQSTSPELEPLKSAMVRIADTLSLIAFEVNFKDVDQAKSSDLYKSLVFYKLKLAGLEDISSIQQDKASAVTISFSGNARQ